MNSKVFILGIFLAGFFGTAFSQESLKIGHVNIPEIIQKLPETDSVQALLKKETDVLEKMYDEMVKEHDSNVKKYEGEKAGYSEFIRQTKESELMDSADKIQKFQQDASQKVQKRNTDLLQPIYEKVNKAIKSVATREGFTYILDVSNGTVVYQSPGSLNINPLVLKELGL